MSIYHFLAVGAGGFFGSIFRYGLARVIDARFVSYLPWGTFTVNVYGSLVLGFVMAIVTKRTDAEIWRLLLGVGFCGGFTTFSTFAFENFNYLQQRLYSEFFLYAILSFIGCIIAIMLGIWIGNRC
jgi:CrcB protein